MLGSKSLLKFIYITFNILNLEFSIQLKGIQIGINKLYSCMKLAQNLLLNVFIKIILDNLIYLKN